MLETMSRIVCNLLEARTIAHKHHLNSLSYAQHMALREFYEGIGEIADTLAEESQGYLGELLDLGEIVTAFEYTAEEDPSSFLHGLETSLRAYRENIPEEATHILNTLDAAFSLISSTQYKLRFLQ